LRLYPKSNAMLGILGTRNPDDWFVWAALHPGSRIVHASEIAGTP
jgi:hypothetical protein